MQNKKLLIISLLVLLLVITGAVFVVTKFSQKPAPVVEEEEQVIDLPQVDATVKVDVQPGVDGRSIDLSVKEISQNTESIEYEVTYLTGDGSPKGALGKINLNGKTEISRNILFGTCSTGGKCTYDLGIKSVKVVLKFNSPTGASQFSKEYPLQ